MTAPAICCPNCGHDVITSTAVDGWLSIAETARLQGISVRTVEAQRRTWLPGVPACLRRGPEPVKDETSGRIWYREGDVRALLAERGPR